MRSIVVGLSLAAAFVMPIATNSIHEASRPDAVFNKLRRTVASADALEVSISGYRTVNGVERRITDSVHTLNITDRSRIRQLAGLLEMKSSGPSFGACACRGRTVVHVYKNGSKVAGFFFRMYDGMDYGGSHFELTNDQFVRSLHELAMAQPSLSNDRDKVVQ